MEKKSIDMDDNNVLLEVENLTVGYNTIKALHGVTLCIKKGEIISVIGANGAGKSTLLKTIAGVKKPISGTIKMDGQEIQGMRPDLIVKSGIAMVPEGRRIFPDLTVEENLELGAYPLSDRHLKKTIFHLVLHTFPRLKERLKQHGGTLSGGEQQMLAIGRALMGNPRLLLLDEPSMGLSPIITKEIFSLIKYINRERHISIILVEQNAHMALEISRRAYVLENGAITIEGESSSIKKNPKVIDAYLGV
ncbi:MAG: ABC transporter ATP-binding protein [Syntrophorhabdaceae bacterium]|nr:ABC transporter ATP-binding protein [Syntrophorhabdaceae bacterium]